MITVNKQEFETFLDEYPNKLVFDVYHVPDPPVGTYNDFTTGLVWPESIIAEIHFERDGSVNHYRIKANKEGEKYEKKQD